MAINVTINGTELRDDTVDFQVVFFTITKNSNVWKFSHGSVPSSLTTDAQIKTWLKEKKDEIIENIQLKIANGTFTNKHPKWLEWQAQIDAASSLADIKMILKKIVKRIQ